MAVNKSSAFPQHLTMDEYNQYWKPQGWNLLIIGPTSTWRQEWGEWESIRDIVQNCLDESESYTSGYDADGLFISDKGRGIAVSDFLLGPSKLKPNWARGKFGEGMKIAALALLRKGYPIRVDTVDREVLMLFVTQETNGRAETLSALWRPDGNKMGTTFHIIGYIGSDFKDRFAVNLPDSAISFEAPSRIDQPKLRYNQLIEYTFPAGSRLFARDIYFRDLNSVFSYNLWSFEMAPDRFGPKEESDMWVDMGRLWMCVDDIRLLGIFLQMVASPPLIDTEESHLVSLDTWKAGTIPGKEETYFERMQGNSESWQQAWNQTFGEDTVIRTNSRYDSITKHLGYRSVSVSWGVESALSSVIKSDVAVRNESQERLREVQTIPDLTLTPTQMLNLKLTRGIARRVAYRVRGVHAAIIPPASDRVRTAGMYSRTTEEIYINADQLSYARNAIDTAIHEIAHHTSGAEDGEKAHYQAISEIAGKVVMLTKQGAFDDIIEERNFTW
jgi:hypothetical protein